MDNLILPDFPKIPKGEPVTHWIDEATQELVLAHMSNPVCGGPFSIPPDPIPVGTTNISFTLSIL
jgi:hypothetical protein